MTTTTSKPRVTNAEELAERLAGLPEFSRSVYAIIKAGLYAEPFFSDLTAEDVAKTMNVPVQAINAALGHLMSEGVVTTEEYRPTRRTVKIFIHTPEHDNYQE